MQIVGFNPRHQYEIRLVADDGAQLGIYKLQDAIRKAEEANLDLINISPSAKPPVGKIMDYGKYKYKQKQIEKESKKKQHVVQVKEVKFGVNIDTHDFDVKLNKVKEFLSDGCKVKVAVTFQGREIAHPDLGAELLTSILAKIKDTYTQEGGINTERREIFVFIKAKDAKPKVETKEVKVEVQTKER